MSTYDSHNEKSIPTTGRPLHLSMPRPQVHPRPSLKPMTSRFPVRTPAAISREASDDEYILGRDYAEPKCPEHHHDHKDRKWTQEDQNVCDEQTRRKTMKDLVQSWMDRLQLISVMTTFFAAIEGQLLVITTPAPGGHPTRMEQVAGGALAGALVVHCYAAILSFLGAFFLIRYKFKEARHEEIKAESGVSPVSSTAADGTQRPSDSPLVRNLLTRT